MTFGTLPTSFSGVPSKHHRTGRAGAAGRGAALLSPARLSQGGPCGAL